MDECCYPEELLTRSTLWKVIKSFVPNEYLETVDDSVFSSEFSSMELIWKDQIKVVQYVLDNSNDKMRMYGSAKTLTGELNKFRTFSMCHKFFECERSEPYNYESTIYSGNDGRFYISKDSVFVYIQLSLYYSLPFLRFLHNRLILTLFLKVQEEKLKNSLEFIPLDYMSDVDEKQIVDTVKKEKLASNNHPKYSLNDYIDLFKKLLPESCTANEISSLREYVVRVYNEQSKGNLQDPDALFSSYIEIKHLLDFVKQMTEKIPHIFLRWIDVPPETKFKVPAIVRFFGDELSTYFIEDELEEAFKIFQSGHAQPSRIIEGNFLYTIDTVAAEKKYGTDLRKMKLIQDKSPTHAFTPIPTNFGVFVVSGLHAFLRLFHRIIFVHKVFQKLTSDNMEPFSRYLNIIDEVLDLRGTRKYMLKYDVLHRLEKMTADYWNEILPQAAKDIRDVEPYVSFTVQHLKNELVHLGLTNAFPNISDHAEEAYEAILKGNRENHLKTCHLFAAIQNCQYFCVLLRFPILLNFLRTQGVSELLSIPTEILPIRMPLLVRVRSRIDNFQAETESIENTESKEIIDELKTVKDQLNTAKDQIKQWEDRKLDEKLSECQLEIENLKRTVETGEDREQKLKENNQSLTNSIEDVKKKMGKLEAEKLLNTEINNELIKRNVDLKEKVQSAESRLKNEVSQRSQEMERLKESMAVEKDHMNREISNLKEEKERDAELILKLEGEVKKEQKQNERLKLESELRLEVEKTNHAVDQIQMEKEFSRLRDVCDDKDQIIRDLRNRLSRFPGGLP